MSPRPGAKVRQCTLVESLKPVMRKAPSSQRLIRAESSKAGQFFRATTSVTKTAITRCSMNWGHRQPAWKLQSFSTHLAASPDSAKPKLTQFRPTSKPSSQGCRLGLASPGTDGRKTGRKSIGNLWFLCYLLCMVIQIVGGFGNNISTAESKNRDGSKFCPIFGIQFFTIKSITVC